MRSTKLVCLVVAAVVAFAMGYYVGDVEIGSVPFDQGAGLARSDRSTVEFPGKSVQRQSHISQNKMTAAQRPRTSTRFGSEIYELLYRHSHDPTNKRPPVSRPDGISTPQPSILTEEDAIQENIRLSRIWLGLRSVDASIIGVFEDTESGKIHPIYPNTVYVHRDETGDTAFGTVDTSDDFIPKGVRVIELNAEDEIIGDYVSSGEYLMPPAESSPYLYEYVDPPDEMPSALSSDPDFDFDQSNVRRPQELGSSFSPAKNNVPKFVTSPPVPASLEREFEERMQLLKQVDPTGQDLKELSDLAEKASQSNFVSPVRSSRRPNE